MGNQHGLPEAQCPRTTSPGMLWENNMDSRKPGGQELHFPALPRKLSLAPCRRTPFFALLHYRFRVYGGFSRRFGGFPLNFGFSALHFRVLPRNFGVPSPNLVLRPPPHFWGSPSILGIPPNSKPPTILEAPTILSWPATLILRFFPPMLGFSPHV